MPLPKKNTAYSFVVGLVDQASRPSFKANPTIAAGDFKHSGDGSALTNLTNLPAADPAASRLVKIVLTAAEMNYDRVCIQCVDAAGSEWDEVIVYIDTTTQTVDDLATQSSLNTLDDYVDTEVAAIKAKTDNLPSDPADASDIASSFSTVNSTLTTIAGYIDTEIATLLSRLGTPSDLGSGASVAANLVDIEAQTDDIGTAGAGLTAVPWNAAWDAEVQSEVQDAIEVNNLDHLVKIAVDTDFATTVHLNSVVGHLADNGTAATYDRTTDSQEAIRDRGDAAWTTATGFSTLTQADIRTAVGMASANLDTQLSTIAGYIDTEVAAILAAVDTEVGAIKTVTDQMVFTTANRLNVQVYGMEAGVVTAAAVATGAIDADALAADVITDIWQGTALTEAYATDGSTATPAQLLYMIWSALAEFSISGTTITAKKLDGSTTAMTFTLDSSTTPTSRTRAS